MILNLPEESGTLILNKKKNYEVIPESDTSTDATIDGNGDTIRTRQGKGPIMALAMTVAVLFIGTGSFSSLGGSVATIPSDLEEAVVSTPSVRKSLPLGPPGYEDIPDDPSDFDAMKKFLVEMEKGNSDVGAYAGAPDWRRDCCDTRMVMYEGNKCNTSCILLCSGSGSTQCKMNCNVQCGKLASELLCGSSTNDWAGKPRCRYISKVDRPGWCNFYWDIFGQYGECCDKNKIYDCSFCGHNGCQVHY